MKIAILHDNFPPRSIGGADIIAFNVARALQKRGHEIIVITASRNADDEGVIEYEGLRIHTIVTSPSARFRAWVSLWNPRVVRQVRALLAEFKPDVVHAHNVHAYLSYRALSVAKKLDAHVALTCHDVLSFNFTKLTDFINPSDLSIPKTFNYRVSPWRQLKKNRFRYNPFRNLFIRRVLRNSVNQVVAVSDALKQALNDNGIGNVRVIHNGIDVSEWEEEAANVLEFKKKHDVGDAAILYGGRLSDVKGGAKIIEALAQISRSVPSAQLLVVGQKDAYSERMLEYAKTLGVGDNIIFTGWVSGRALHCAYHVSSVVAVPSLCFDSLPTMILEGMACRKPVVSTCFGGSREAVEDGTTGYIVNPYDVKMMAGKIEELLRDKEKNNRFGNAGYERVLRDFSLKKQTEEYEQVFSAVSRKNA